MEMIIREIKHWDENGLREVEEVHTSWDEIRSVRNEELNKSDWRAVSDRTMSSEWVDYRQFLRDLPSLYSDPDEAADAWNEYEKPE
tara:strand:- start:1978 stop:2235 length:258 start_codon:yes stop_codon:yes gene_type:complete